MTVIGRVVTLAEADYCYGVGPVTLRVERIDAANPVQYDGEPWYQVEGVALRVDGSELGHRQVLARGRRLRTAAGQ
jgi:hypothetical protein